MALKLSRNLQEENASQNGKGFNVTGVRGTEYNLDNIAASKSRTNSDKEIATQVTSKDQNTLGAMSVKDESNKIFANNADAARYLFRNEPSTDSFSPSVTLRRPIVIWEEGETEQKPGASNAEGLYDIIFRLEDELKGLKGSYQSIIDSITNDIQLYNDGTLRTDGSKIPNIEAVYDFIKNNIHMGKGEDLLLETNEGYNLKVLNGSVISSGISGYYNADCSDSYYDMEKIEGNLYQLKLGGQ